MRKLWSAAEAEYLDRLVGDLPWPVVLDRFQRHARRQGWPKRSDKAVALRLRRCGQRARCRSGEWVNAPGVAELLGVPPDRVACWLRRPTTQAILQPVMHQGLRYMERRNWRRLAQLEPEVLGGIPADLLFLLLEDRELAEQVAARHPLPLGDYRVRCVETGRIYPSAQAAGRALGITGGAISLAISQRRPVAALGRRFERLRHVAADAPQALPIRSGAG